MQNECNQKEGINKMGKFKNYETSIDGVYVIEPTVLETKEDISWKLMKRMLLKKLE